MKTTKTDKSVANILGYLAEFVLQQRMDCSSKNREHLKNLGREINYLKDQVFPNMDILHLLVFRPLYNPRARLAELMKDRPLEGLALAICFTLNDKLNGVSHTGEVWKLAVRPAKAPGISPEGCAYTILFLLAQACRQLYSGRGLSDLLHNPEASRKYIIDFKI
jgi:hypothetical protein